MAISSATPAPITALALPAAHEVHGAQAAWTRPSWRWVALWLLLMLVGGAGVATWRHAQSRQHFDDEARTLHRTIAQRAGQHDAHLTNLHAIAHLDDPERATFLAVASAIQTFYPRVASIDLVRLSPAPEVLASTRKGAPMLFSLADVAQRAASLGIGKAAMLDAPAGPGYALVKRIGASPLTALVLVIDAARLTEMDGPVTPPVELWLTDARGTVFGAPRAAPPPSGEGSAFWQPRALRFEEELGSTSQPLRLVVSRRPAWSELLPAGWLLVLAAGSAALLWVAGNVQRVRRARRDAARQAQELRLAHAMRVNGLGEMASGIAHELTQPLTAMLSQSQAGLRLIEHGADAAAMLPILQANVRLAKRAGDILDRIRSYVSQREPSTQAVDLNPLAAGVADLARADLEARGIALELALDAQPAVARIDAIAIEQVLHNLVRNAAEALQGVDAAAPRGARIVVATRRHGGRAEIEVRDNGPGMTAEQASKVFLPFFTTKPGGMGLGLSLCERLVESLGGRIDVRSAPGEGSSFTVGLRADAQPQAGT